MTEFVEVTDSRIWVDKESSEILGKECSICTQCGATGLGEKKLVHYATCCAPDLVWFEGPEDIED